MAKGKYAEWIEPDGLIKIQGWARDGLNDEQIAANMGITPSTLYVWKNKYKEISEASKKGKEVVDREVENALHKRALGFEYEEVTQELVENDEGRMELQVTKVVRKTQAPDTGALAFWLKNRMPDVWRERRDNTHSGPDGGPIQTQNKMDLSALTPEELKKLAGIE